MDRDVCIANFTQIRRNKTIKTILAAGLIIDDGLLSAILLIII